jgi:hypothetical protein
MDYVYRNDGDNNNNSNSNKHGVRGIRRKLYTKKLRSFILTDMIEAVKVMAQRWVGHVLLVAR